MNFKYIGRKDYLSTWDYQKSLIADRMANKICDTVIFVEHDPVYTIGKTGSEKNIKKSSIDGNILDIPVVYIDRGGDITFHGPGQLVGYPILYLGDYYFDLHRYLRDIEEVIILTLNDFALQGYREEGLTGVWVDGKKIAAIGVKVSRWYTMHGFALNVNTDLGYFDNIVPCGIKDREITSVREMTGKVFDLELISQVTSLYFQKIFQQKK